MEIEKTLVKRSRLYTNSRGGVVKSNIENYLREDIHCHSTICEICEHENPKLSSSIQNGSKFLYYVIPSHEVLKTHYLLLDGLKENVILTETLFYSIDKKKQFFKYKEWIQGINAYKEKEEIIRNSEKSKYQVKKDQTDYFDDENFHQNDNFVVFFSNEHFKNTYTEKLKNEKTWERNERAQLKAGKFYAEHLGNNVNIIVLTNGDGKKYLESCKNDNEVEKSINIQNLHLMNVEEYIKFLKENCFSSNKMKLNQIDTLLELVDAEIKKLAKKERTYDEYVSKEELKKNNHLYIKGRLCVNKFRSTTSFVEILDQLEIEKAKKLIGLKLESFEKIEIGEKKNRNRAIHNDEVYVKLTEKDNWEDKMKPEGIVVAISKRRCRNYVVTIRLDKEEMETGEVKQNRYSICIPLDRRIPKFRIKTTQREKLKNYRFLVKFASWDRDSNYPKGFYVENIGKIGEIETESKSILMEHGLFRKPFSVKVLADLPTSQNWSIPKKEFEERRDMRSIWTCSIDPICCVDIDDAISFAQIDKDYFEIGVHIADVSYYVKPGTELDKEAKERSTSIYMVNKKINMLPNRLSGDLCSLHQKTDKLCVSAIFKVNAKTLEVCDTWFGRTIINSNFSFHYDQVTEILAGKEDRKKVNVVSPDGFCWKECETPEKNTKEFKEMINNLKRIGEFSMHLNKKRMKLGGLELQSIDKVEFKLDKNSKPIGIEKEEEDDVIHKVIAELMILANIGVGKKIYEMFPNNSLMRSHAFPKKASLEELKKIAATRKYDFKFGSNLELGKSIEKIEQQSDKIFTVLIKNLAAKSMNQAVYKCSTEGKETDLYHFGLGADYYTHFTSPIRRYPDLIVHRILLSGLANCQKALYEKSNLEKLSIHMNDVKNKAKLLQRESTLWFQARYFLTQPSPVADGIVHKINKKMIKIFIPTYRINHVLYLTDKDNNLFLPIEDRKTQYINVSSDDNLDVDEFLPPHLFNIDFDPEAYKTKITFFKEEDSTIDTSKKPVEIKLFDHLLVNVKVRQTRAHFPKLVLRLHSFKVISSKYKQKFVTESQNLTPHDLKKKIKTTVKDKELEKKKFEEERDSGIHDDEIQYKQENNIYKEQFHKVCELSKKEEKKLLKQKQEIEKESIERCNSTMFNLTKTKIENTIQLLKKRISKLKKKEKEEKNENKLLKIKDLKKKFEEQLNETQLILKEYLSQK